MGYVIEIVGMPGWRYFVGTALDPEPCAPAGSTTLFNKPYNPNRPIRGCEVNQTEPVVVRARTGEIDIYAGPHMFEFWWDESGPIEDDEDFVSGEFGLIHSVPHKTGKLRNSLW